MLELILCLQLNHSPDLAVTSNTSRPRCPARQPSKAKSGLAILFWEDIQMETWSNKSKLHLNIDPLNQIFTELVALCLPKLSWLQTSSQQKPLHFCSFEIDTILSYILN